MQSGVRLLSACNGGSMAPQTRDTRVSETRRGPDVLNHFSRRKLAGRKRRVAALAAFVLAALLGVGVYAFTAKNTVEAGRAGVGSETVGGYTIKEPEYTFGTNGTTITKAKFELNHAASNVDFTMIDGAGTPTKAEYEENTCTEKAGSTGLIWECELKVPIHNEEEAQKLYVLAVSHGPVTIE